MERFVICLEGILICKTITKDWKEKYSFPSYILKTTFLWILEESWNKEEKLTEDGYRAF